MTEDTEIESEKNLVSGTYQHSTLPKSARLRAYALRDTGQAIPMEVHLPWGACLWTR